MKTRALFISWVSALALLGCGDSHKKKPVVVAASACETNDGCEAAEHCDSGECAADVCEPGKTSCGAAGRSVQRCSAAGDSFDLTLCGPKQRCVEEDGEAKCQTSQACAAGECVEPVEQPCDPKTKKCTPQTCEPDAKGCLAETVATCKADGSGFEPSGDDCAESEQACWEGACLPIVCTGKLSCVDGDSFQCSANRTQSELAAKCSGGAGQFCNAETGECQDFVCAPGLPTCNDDLATSCADDGSHALDAGVDCTATGKVCWAAECATPICEPDSYHCDGTKLQHCIAKGTAYEVAKDCGEGTVCDADAGTCRLQKCLPDQPACDGNVATTCDATGLDYVGSRTDCSQDGDVCVAGACKPVICAPSAVYCAAGELRECGANGGSFQLLDTCLESEFCDAANEVCAPDACTAAAPVCAGDRLTTCEADGSGPAAGGKDCAAFGQVCDRKACRDLVCNPSARFCDAGNVALCNAAGTDWAPYDTCRASEFCDATDFAAALCAPDICPQTANGCQGERTGLCNLDGSGFSTVGPDCSVSKKVCDLSGTCAITALDAFGANGAAVPFASSAIHFEFFRMLTPRKLTQLQAAVVPGVAGNVTWVVYKSSNLLGTYTLIDQATTDDTVNAGYLSSGALDRALDQGTYYLFGVAIKGAHNTSIEEGAAPAALSFGQLLGGFSYVAGATPTIPTTLEVGAGLLQDDVAMRVVSGVP